MGEREDIELRARQRGIDHALDRSKLPAPSPRPIPLVMNCPRCGAGHVDHPPWDTRPHHEHLCEACGALFEALDSDVPTVGTPSDGEAVERRDLTPARWGTRG